MLPYLVNSYAFIPTQLQRHCLPAGLLAPLPRLTELTLLHAGTYPVDTLLIML